MRGNEVYFLPLGETPSHNIHSLLMIQRQTNKHTQLAVAILKSPKDLERV